MKTCLPVAASTAMILLLTPMTTNPGTAMIELCTPLLRQSCQRNAPVAGFKARKLPGQRVPLIVVLALAAYSVVPSQPLDEKLFP